MTLAEYDAHIAVTAAEDGVYAARLEDGWRVGGGVNGGYVLGVIGNALRAASPERPDPLVVSAYYLGPTVAGDAVIRTTPRRVGGSTATFAADLEQDGQTRVTALATFGRLGDLPEDAKAWERGVDELAEEDEEIAEYIHSLEETRDTAELPEASGEAIAREFERFLKRNRGDDA